MKPIVISTLCLAALACGSKGSRATAARDAAVADEDDPWAGTAKKSVPRQIIDHVLRKEYPAARKALADYRGRPVTDLKVSVELAALAGGFGDVDFAERELEKAAAHPDADAFAYSSLAGTALRRGDCTKALAYHRKAFAMIDTIGPGETAFSYDHDWGSADLDARYLVLASFGSALNECHGEREALAVLAKAQQYEPEHPVVHNLIGEAHRKLGELDAAERSYAQASKLDPDFAQPYNNLALIREEQCRFDDEVALLERARELKPDSSAAYFNLCTAYVAVGRSDGGLQACRKYLGPERYASDREGVAMIASALEHDPGQVATAIHDGFADRCRKLGRPLP